MADDVRDPAWQRREVENMKVLREKLATCRQVGFTGEERRRAQRALPRFGRRVEDYRDVTKGWME
jgi:hypothetical protein